MDRRSRRSAQAKRCERCGRYPCRCPKPRSLPPEKQVAHVAIEKKGRRGKTVTVIHDLQLAPGDAHKLARRLKKACGAGGTVKTGAIEIQGDRRGQVAQVLEELGYQVKIAG